MSGNRTFKIQKFDWFLRCVDPYRVAFVGKCERIKSWSDKNYHEPYLVLTSKQDRLELQTKMISLRNWFHHSISREQKLCHVPFQYKPVKKLTQKTEWNFILKMISHYCSYLMFCKMVLMPHAPECTLYHFVLKKMRPVESGYLNCQLLRYAEVFRFPGYPVAMFTKSACSSGDSTFICIACR